MRDEERRIPVRVFANPIAAASSYCPGDVIVPGFRNGTKKMIQFQKIFHRLLVLHKNVPLFWDPYCHCRHVFKKTVGRR